MIYQQLFDADTKNTAAVVDLQRIIENEASVYEYAADPRLAEVPTLPEARRKNLLAALDTLQQAAKFTRQIIAETPSHDPWTSDLASLLIRINAVRRALNMPQDAATTIASLATLRKAAQAPQATAGDIDLAVRAVINAGPLGSADLSSAVAWAEHGVQLTRNRRPDYFLLLAMAYRADNQPALAAEAAHKGLALLDLADQPDTHNPRPSFRLRKLLTVHANHPKPA